MQNKKGKELEFISRIERDGKGIVLMDKHPIHEDNTSFELNALSLTKGTYIACEFNSYVVKIKK